MAAKGITEAKLRDAVEHVNQAYRDGYYPGSSPSAMQVAAQRFGKAYVTFQHYMRKARAELNLTPDDSLVRTKDPASEDHLAAKETDTSAIRLAATERKLRVANTANKSLREQLASVHELRELAFELAETSPTPPDWVLKPGVGKSKGKEVPVLFTSDFQLGEVVNPDELEGVNEYDVNIAEQRYQRLISKTIDLCFKYHTPAAYPGLIYLRGGDAISGAIHDELAETDELTPTESAMRLAEMEIWGIERLQEKFGKVHVISIPGNHGRTTRKPRKKKYSAHNLETLATAIIEKYFAGTARGKKPNVTFYTPESGEAMFTIGKFNFLLTHGDRIGARGGQGFIGPVGTVAKGIYKVRQQYAKRRILLHYVLMGHFHVRMDPQFGMVNGALVGPSEYSMYELRAEPEPAAQLLFFVHPEVGVTLKRDIVLSKLGGEKSPVAWASQGVLE